MLHCIIIMEIKYKRILRKVEGEFIELCFPQEVLGCVAGQRRLLGG